MDSVPHVLRKCAICGAEKDLVNEETWFFIGGPSASKVLCSRECLIQFINSLPEEQPPSLLRLKHGSCHVIIPGHK
jgi:hypothetical protein